MKKLGLVLLLSLISQIVSASCGASYESAGKALTTFSDNNTSDIASTSVGVDLLGIGFLNAPAIPIFTASGAIVGISVSVDYLLKADVRVIAKLIKDSHSGAYSSEMEELLQFTENYTGMNVSKSELTASIIALDEANTFCTDDLQGIQDFKLSVASHIEKNR